MSNSQLTDLPQPPTAAFLIIGNEILDGSTQDKNLRVLIDCLRTKAIALKEVRIVRDEEAAISQALRDTTALYDHVFTSGGIGPTHDDITSITVAKFFGVRLELQQQVLDLMLARYPKREYLNAAVEKMAMLPAGATLIPNSLSIAPGFKLHNVHVLAGVPAIFKVMLEATLTEVAAGIPLEVASILVYAGESRIAQLLADLAASDPALEIGSYPRLGQDGKVFVKVVARSHQPGLVTKARHSLTRQFSAKGFKYRLEDA